MPRIVNVPQADGSVIEVEVSDTNKMTDQQIISRFNEEPPSGLWDKAKDIGKSALSGASEGLGDYIGTGVSTLTQMLPFGGGRQPAPDGSKVPILGNYPKPNPDSMVPADQDPLSHAIAGALRYKHMPQTKAGQYAKSMAGAAAPALAMPVGVGATALNTGLAATGGAIAQHGVDAGWDDSAIAAGSIAPSLLGGIASLRPNTPARLADATLGGRSARELNEAVQLSDDARKWGLPLTNSQILSGPNPAASAATQLYGTRAGQPLTNAINAQGDNLRDLTTSRWATDLDKAKNEAYGRGRKITIGTGEVFDLNTRLMNALRRSDMVDGTPDYRNAANAVQRHTWGIMGTNKANATGLNSLATAMKKKANGVPSREATFNSFGRILRDEAELLSPAVREGNQLHGLRSTIADRMENAVGKQGGVEFQKAPSVGVGTSGNLGFNLGGLLGKAVEPGRDRSVAKILADPEFRNFLKLTGRSRLQIAQPYAVGGMGSLSYGLGGLGDADD